MIASIMKQVVKLLLMPQIIQIKSGIATFFLNFQILLYWNLIYFKSNMVNKV